MGGNRAWREERGVPAPLVAAASLAWGANQQEASQAGLQKPEERIPASFQPQVLLLGCPPKILPEQATVLVNAALQTPWPPRELNSPTSEGSSPSSKALALGSSPHSQNPALPSPPPANRPRQWAPPRTLQPEPQPDFPATL